MISIGISAILRGSWGDTDLWNSGVEHKWWAFYLVQIIYMRTVVDPVGIWVGEIAEEIIKSSWSVFVSGNLRRQVARNIIDIPHWFLKIWTKDLWPYSAVLTMIKNSDQSRFKNIIIIVEHCASGVSMIFNARLVVVLFCLLIPPKTDADLFTW